MHDDYLLSWQNYIHGSSQGQFIAETYIVFFLSILTNIKEILGYWSTTFLLPFFDFFKNLHVFIQMVWFLAIFGDEVLVIKISPQIVLYPSVSFICVLELVWKCNGQSNLWRNLRSIHILYLCTLFYPWHTYYSHFLISREVIVSQLCFSGFMSCRNVI